jgi:hypothetical protein
MRDSVESGLGRGVAGVVALLALGLTVWSRTRGLSVSFWNDEAFTAFYFIERGPAEIFRGAGMPAEFSLNNHRLFSLLAWATTKALGPSELVYRLWAAIPGILAALGIVSWAWRRLGPWHGATVATLVALAPLHAEVSTQARGYGLGLLGEAIMLAGAVRVADGSRRGGLALTALGGLVGIGSLSAFAIAYVWQLAPLLLLPGCLVPTSLVLLAVGLASVAFYWPVLWAIAEAGHQDFGPLVTWKNVVDGPPRDLFSDSLHLWLPGAPHRLTAALYLTLVALAALHLWKRRDAAVFGLLLAPIVGTYATLAALGAHVVPRYASYLLLHVLVLAAIGLVEAVQLAARRRIAAIALVALLLAGTVRATATFVRSESAREAFPIEAYREALEIPRQGTISLVVTNSTFGAGFQYYGRDLGVRFLSDDELQELFCRKRLAFVYVHYRLFGRPTDLHCLLERSPVSSEIAQLDGGPGEGMTVYVVSAR